MHMYTDRVTTDYLCYNESLLSDSGTFSNASPIRPNSSSSTTANEGAVWYRWYPLKILQRD